jgi:hypothetical protein
LLIQPSAQNFTLVTPGPLVLGGESLADARASAAVFDGQVSR